MIKLTIILAIVFAVLSTSYHFKMGNIIAYGDAESHLNIAKRVVDSLTPGFSQLGGIWLPLPHMLLVPFVYSDILWRSGLAGSITSGISYVIAVFFLYKLILFVTNKAWAAFFGSMVFALNPNILYMQTTPMTEMPLITLSLISIYFFVKYLYSEEGSRNIYYLVLASFFGFCTTLTRYDGWFLVLTEAGIIGMDYIIQKDKRAHLGGKLVLFITLAFFGVLIWLLWDYLILKDPFYFTNSEFSAKSQQNGWLVRGELPTYKSILNSLLYYSFTSLRNIGIAITASSIVGLVFFAIDSRYSLKRWYLFILLFVPFIFYVVTLYSGQSVIFIPDLTPASFEWNLFNVRYGLMMIPTAAFGVAYLASKIKRVSLLNWLIVSILFLQGSSFFLGYEKVITWEDGVRGLSHSKNVDAEQWLKNNYDGGLLLIDDYARTVSVIRSNVPMSQVIYVGNKPYWEESLREPEKYANWIVLQKDDAVWNSLYDDPIMQGRLYKYFEKAYTSEEILVFKRNRGVATL